MDRLVFVLLLLAGLFLMINAAQDKYEHSKKENTNVYK